MKQESNFIFGVHPVIEAIKAGKEIEKILVKTGTSTHQIYDLLKLIREKKIPFQYVPAEKLGRLTNANHQGVIAFVPEISFTSIETLLPTLFEQGKNPLFIVLDRITDVRNFGAIARSAECAGVDAIIIPMHGAAQINADAVKTSAGALNTIPVCREYNLKETLKYLKDSGLQILAVTEKTNKNYFEANLVTPTVLIFGSEFEGISGEYLKLCDEKISIPMQGSIDSLNVSVATGIIVFEALKQRLNSIANEIPKK